MFRVIGGGKYVVVHALFVIEGPRDFLFDMYEQFIRQRDKFVSTGLAQVVATVRQASFPRFPLKQVDPSVTSAKRAQSFNNSFYGACLRIMAVAAAAA